MRQSFLLVVVFLFSVIASACGGGSSTSSSSRLGIEGESCQETAECEEELLCINNICIKNLDGDILENENAIENDLIVEEEKDIDISDFDTNDANDADDFSCQLTEFVVSLVPNGYQINETIEDTGCPSKKFYVKELMLNKYQKHCFRFPIFLLKIQTVESPQGAKEVVYKTCGEAYWDYQCVNFIFSEPGKYVLKVWYPEIADQAGGDPIYLTINYKPPTSCSLLEDGDI